MFSAEAPALHGLHVLRGAPEEDGKATGRASACAGEDGAPVQAESDRWRPGQSGEAQTAGILAPQVGGALATDAGSAGLQGPSRSSEMSTASRP